MKKSKERCIYLCLVITCSLVSRRSERDTIRGVQIRAGAVYILLVMCSYSTIMASELVQHNYIL